MDIPEEPGAVVVSILVIVISLFLLVLQRGSLSERQQTGVWVVFTILFFLICNVLVRGNARAGLVTGTRTDPSGMADIRQAEVGR